MSGNSVLVFGHRGACGYLPENTIESMELAFEQGADAVEFDVVFTKDGHAIIRHDLDLASTTDISDHSFLSTKVDQLTKADISRLRAKERYPDGRVDSANQDGKYFVPTLRQLLANQQFNGKHLIIEIKHGAHFEAIGVDPIQEVKALLEQSDWSNRGMKISLESFEFEFLLRAKLEIGPELNYVFLSARDTLPEGITELTDELLAEIADNFDAVSVAMSMVLTGDLVARAKKIGLEIYAFTARLETAEGNVEKWFERLVSTGVDGIFADQPDLLLKTVADLT
ncbi:MAG: glycerophosphodiester phosphodiesterase family protein [Aquiluna sp.]|nr:glycerophosphodiester phosphodiesterase family protein [Aquiluna sp.]